MEILLFVLILSLLFPGSKGVSVSEYALAPVFLLGSVLLVTAVCTASIWVGKSVAVATGEDWAGIAAGFATLGAILTVNFFVAGWDIRRRGGTP